MDIAITLPEKKKKAPPVLNKKGINLARRERDPKVVAGLAVGIPVTLVLLGCFVKFGVMDPLAVKAEAVRTYEEAHARYVTMQNTADTYDEVLLKYRTLAMDWMQDVESEKFVSVERIKVVRLIEGAIMPRGTVKNVTISKNMVTLNMADMNLGEIVEMFEQVEGYPYVSSCALVTAKTVQNTPVEADAEAADVEEEQTAVDNKMEFTMQIYLQAEVEGE